MGKGYGVQLKNSFIVTCIVLIVLTDGLFFNSAPLLAQEKGEKESERIIIGTEYDYPPFSYLDEQGKPAGFNIELTRAIALATGLSVEIDYRPWGEIRKDLETGKIHAISGMYFSKDRDKVVDFSPPYAVITHAIFARRNSPEIESEERLRGKEIIVMQGDIMHDYVIEKQFSQSLVIAKNPAEALRLLSSGQHDYALLAELPGLYWVKELKLSNIVTLGPPLRPSKYCYAVKEGETDLLFRLNEGLVVVKETGRYRELYDKWLGVLEPKEVSIKFILKYFAIIIVPLLLISAGSILWSRSLRRHVAQRTEELAKELTERKRVTAALQEREIFLDTLINAIPIPVYYKDAAGRYLGFNKAFESFFGQSRERLIGKTAFDVSPKELAETYNAMDLNLFKNHGIQQFESQVQNANGDLLDVIFNKSVFINSAGTIAGLIGAILDITGRKRTEREREKLISELQKALQEIKTLSGLLPICAHCKKIRDDKGYWKKIENYIQEHSNAKFSHSICRDCAKKLYPDINIYDD